MDFLVTNMGEYGVKMETSRTVVIQHDTQPTGSKKEHLDTILTDRGITSEASVLFFVYRKYFLSHPEGAEAKIKVSASLSNLAFFYERLRNTIDYKQDQALFRNSIERITKRLLWENPSKAIDTDKLAEELVRELIWARYVGNDKLPKRSLKEISVCYERYLRLLSQIADNRSLIGRELSWRDWIFGICAGEIEEIIRPEMAANDILTEEVVNWFSKKYEWENSPVAKPYERLYYWSAVYRSLFKADLPTLRYHLLKRFIPSWFKAQNDPDGSERKLLLAYARVIERGLNSIEHMRLYRFIDKLTPPFNILAEIIREEDSETYLLSRDLLVKKINYLCQVKYDEIKGRVARGISRSIIYIFVSKVILALILEIPYEYFVLNGIRLLPILINVTLPPALMFLVGLMIKKPGVDNTRLITQSIVDFIYNGDRKKTAFSVNPRKKKNFTGRAFTIIYSMFFVGIFSLISYGLFKLEFSVISALIFFMFLSLVLLFGFRVKHSASELSVSQAGEGFWTELVSTLSLPFLGVGAFLSGQLSKLNFLVVFLDFLIEAPLKNILGLLEDWNIFMKEKKEDIINVPGT